ncbi:MAG TPA: glycosyltransferase [Alphaproteobacteria bacterium]|nr:glycosyltransferase [Alphaproteobacteria bacterium]
MTLALYLPRLPMGGIERATVTLANHWAAKGRPVTLLLDRAEGALLDAVSDDVPVEVLGASRTLWALPKLASWLRRNRPAVLHSALPHNSAVALVAGLRSSTRITVAEHSLLADKIRIDPGLARIVPVMRRLYPAAAAVLAASDAVAGDMKTILGLTRPISVVGNPIVPDGFDPARLPKPLGAGMRADAPAPAFIAIGRMAPVKDFPTLLRAFRYVLDRRPARLTILGDGPERASLAALAAELDLGTSLNMPGVTPNPWPYIAHAAALAVSSVSEGFGNMVVEAMACGTPVISTRCGAPADLLQGGKLGILVDVGDAEALGRAMLAALDQPVKRAALRKAASAFTVSAVAARYEAALNLGWS